MQSHILRRRQPDRDAPWSEVITDADRAEAKRLSTQARGEAVASRPAVAPDERSQRPATVEVRHPRLEDSPRFKKFVELVEARMPKALTEIENIKFTSSKERYDYAPAHAAKIVATLRQAVDEVERAFAEEGKRKPRKTFSLFD